MALLFMDGFDHYVTAEILDKWDYRLSATITTTTPRTGVQCLRCGSGAEVGKIIPATGTIICGFGMRKDESGTVGYVDVVRFETAGGAEQFALQYSDSAKTFRVTSGFGQSSGSGVFDLTTGYHHIEVKITFDDTVGAWEYRINGITAESGTGVDTNPQTSPGAGAGTVERVELDSTPSGGEPDSFFDDFYILDDDGSFNNDLLGDVIIDTKFVTSNGTTNAWTPSGAPPNSDMVDELLVDGDTTYVETATNNADELYNVGNVSAILTDIKGVQSNITAKKTTSGKADLSPLVRSPGLFIRTEQTVGQGAYAVYRDVHDTDPDTAAAWGVVDFDGSEFGMRMEG